MKNKSDKKALAGIALLIPAAFVIAAIGASAGSVAINPIDTFRVVFASLLRLPMPEGITEATAAIIWKLRLPRVALAFLTGAAMSAGGAVTQSVLHNPLASPYTLGVSSGASVGAAIVTVCGVSLPFAGRWSLAAAGTLFGVLTVVVCITLCLRIDKNFGSNTIVLLGMVLSLFLSAVFTFVSGLDREKMTLLIRWQQGLFASKGWDSVGVMLVVTVIGIAAVMFFSRELDILSFGDESAMSVGVNAAKVKWLLLAITAVLTGTAVSFAGVIGFIDLIAPHVARRLFSPRHKYLIPLTALIGGSFMVIADLAARMLIPSTELPVGAVTAFIGAPFFALVYFSRRRQSA